MKTPLTRIGATVGLLLVASASVPAQQLPPPMTAGEFRALRERVGRTPPPASAEWAMTLSSEARRNNVARLPVPVRRRTGPALARERDPQLAADRLVVIAVDSGGAAVDWRIVPDPRIVRAESPDATGLLSGTLLTYPENELYVALGTSDDTRELRIYKPRWTGEAWMLDPIAVSAIR